MHNHIMTTPSATAYPRGIRENLHQFIQQAIQVFLVGLVIGMERNVLPVLSSQFGVASGSFLYLMGFVVSFGLVKGMLNFVAGRLSERIGRKKVLLLGWLAAFPIPFMILYADNWNWIIAANVFLGINQGFAWSMTVTSKADITHPWQRGFATGVNEFAGYAAAGIGGLVTAWLSLRYGAREALAGFTLVTASTGLLLALAFIRETLPWAKTESHARAAAQTSQTADWAELPAHPGARDIFVLVSFRHPTFRALCQAGISNKIADALLWVLFPVYLHDQGLDLLQTGSISGIYALVWGAAQPATGALSDRIGRKIPVVGGLWLLAAGIASVPLVHNASGWTASAIVMGLGMALLYPNLIAAMTDLAPPLWRSSALGTYRYWRDTGYAIGAIVLGLTAQASHALTDAFWLTTGLLVLSGLHVALTARETHTPRQTPDKPTQ